VTEGESGRIEDVEDTAEKHQEHPEREVTDQQTRSDVVPVEPPTVVTPGPIPSPVLDQVTQVEAAIRAQSDDNAIEPIDLEFSELPHENTTHDQDDADQDDMGADSLDGDGGRIGPDGPSADGDPGHDDPGHDDPGHDDLDDGAADGVGVQRSDADPVGPETPDADAEVGDDDDEDDDEDDDDAAQAAPEVVVPYVRFDCTDGGRGLSEGAEAARRAVERGECVVLPTDTVYGIGADAFDSEAVQRLLDAKVRGRDMPPPVLIADANLMRALAVDIPQLAEDLVARHWPGPLTVILHARKTLQMDLGETNGTIALRVPDHELARELLRQTGPLAVSSANLSGLPAALNCDDAVDQLGDSVAVYLDGGPVGGVAAPSTIVDFTQNDEGEVLRHGALSVGTLRETLPDAVDLVEPPESENLGGHQGDEPDRVHQDDDVADPEDDDVADPRDHDAVEPRNDSGGVHDGSHRAGTDEKMDDTHTLQPPAGG